MSLVLLGARPPDLLAQAGNSRSSIAQTNAAVSDKLPSDVYPDSRNRLPLVSREALDEEGKKLFDSAVNGSAPGGIQASTVIKLYSPQLEQYQRRASEYLRSESGLGRRITELATLVTAREFDSQYEWTLHEDAARKAGVSPQTIEVVKYRRSLTGLPEEEAAVIQLGREIFSRKKVESATFARALKQFGPQRLVNLVALMGHYAATAALLTTFDQQLPPGQMALLPTP